MSSFSGLFSSLGDATELASDADSALASPKLSAAPTMGDSLPVPLTGVRTSVDPRVGMATVIGFCRAGPTVAVAAEGVRSPSPVPNPVGVAEPLPVRAVEGAEAGTGRIAWAGPHLDARMASAARSDATRAVRLTGVASSLGAPATRMASYAALHCAPVRPGMCMERRPHAPECTCISSTGSSQHWLGE
eukprot:scaffold308338_cov31-Tisochrysis_lutea.AAC.2